MPQIIENWTDIQGKVNSVAAVDDPSGHIRAEITVTRATAVDGFANLLEDCVGKVLKVYARQGLPLENVLKAGVSVRLRVRRGGPNKIYAHPEPL